MKICITAMGEGLDAQFEPRFGRCHYFIIWDNENNSFEAIANPNIDADSGAGIQSAQLVVNKNVSMVISGEVGPKAEQVLKTATIKIVNETNGVIKDIIEKYAKNTSGYDADKKNVEHAVYAVGGCNRGGGGSRNRGKMGGRGGCGGGGMRKGFGNQV